MGSSPTKITNNTLKQTNMNKTVINFDSLGHNDSDYNCIVNSELDKMSDEELKEYYEDMVADQVINEQKSYIL